MKNRNLRGKFARPKSGTPAQPWRLLHSTLTSGCGNRDAIQHSQHFCSNAFTFSIKRASVLNMIVTISPTTRVSFTSSLCQLLAKMKLVLVSRSTFVYFNYSNYYKFILAVVLRSGRFCRFGGSLSSWFGWCDGHGCCCVSSQESLQAQSQVRRTQSEIRQSTRPKGGLQETPRLNDRLKRFISVENSILEIILDNCFKSN